jgi:hypothetical protein
MTNSTSKPEERREMNGSERIAKERARQVESEGYDDEHDDGHSEGELCLAAICYAAPDRIYIIDRNDDQGVSFIDPWPWDEDEDRRRNGSGTILSNSLNRQTIQDRVDQLSKAGALIAAEIDRLIRLAQRLQEG